MTRTPIPGDAWAAPPPCAPSKRTRRVDLVDNGIVKAWKTSIFPNQPLALHRHDVARLIYVLKGGNLDVIAEDCTTVTSTYVWPDGSAHWLEADPPGQLHADALPEGAAPIEVLVVEVPRPPASVAGLVIAAAVGVGLGFALGSRRR